MKTEIIFVIEDDEFFGLMLETHLNKKVNYNGKDHALDYEVYTFPDAESCLARMHEDPAMVIVDYNLGTNMNGAEFVQHARYQYSNTKFLVISANWNNREKCVAKGINNFLLKDEMSVMRIEKLLMDEITYRSSLQASRSGFLSQAVYISLVSIGVILAISYFANHHI